MGLIQSCFGKKGNKVGVLLEEEDSAYKKMEEEIKKEEVDDNIQTKPLPWLMFVAKPNNIKAGPDEANDSTVTEVVQKQGGMAFNIEYKSSVPKLPPINLIKARAPQGDDYEKWKETTDKLLVEKNEQAKIRRDKIILRRVSSARRSRIARSRASDEVDPSVALKASTLNLQN